MPTLSFSDIGFFAAKTFVGGGSSKSLQQQQQPEAILQLLQIPLTNAFSYVTGHLINTCKFIDKDSLLKASWDLILNDMAPKKKFYAVKNGKGGFSGIVNTWAECERYTKGVSGVKYKSFGNQSEAQEFLKPG